VVWPPAGGRAAHARMNDSHLPLISQTMKDFSEKQLPPENAIKGGQRSIRETQHPN
jgi:hypothetical protein